MDSVEDGSRDNEVVGSSSSVVVKGDEVAVMLDNSHSQVVKDVL